MKRLIRLFVASAALASCSNDGQSDGGSIADPLLTACETTMKERLRSPSGYQRIQVNEDREELTLEGYRNWQAERGREYEETILDRRAFESQKPVKWTIFIEFDAPNAFGTPIRGTAICEYANLSGDRSIAEASRIVNVAVNGLTSHEWVMERGRELIR